MPADWPFYVLGAAGMAWGYLGLFHFWFWKSDQGLPQTSGEMKTWPVVSVVIPARNEAKILGRTLPTVARQNYPGRCHVILVNDSSGDETARVAGAIKGVEVLDAGPLEPGWAGKLWALKEGVDHALERFPETGFVWFTDADIAHEDSVLEDLVRAAVLDKRAMVSQMVYLNCQSFWERALVPAFIFFFEMLYPFRAVNSDKSGFYGAAGGCILLNRRWLERIGGITRIKSALIDDCQMAKAVKREGGRIWLGFGMKSRSLRPYTFHDFWTTVARTAFTQLNNSALLLTGTVLAMALVFLAPPVIALAGVWGGHLWLGAGGAIVWTFMAALYTPALRLYRLSPLRGLFLPVVALLYTAMTVDSAVRHWRGRGGQWKGRSYDFEK